jgi:magnesium transporter
MVEDTIERIDSAAALEELRPLLQAGRLEKALELLAALHPADQADVIAELETDERAPLLGRMLTETLAELISYLGEDERKNVVEELDPAVLGPVLDDVDRDVAVDVLHQLAPERARATLATMRAAGEVAPLLPYGDETAGGRMTTDFIALQKEWTVDETLTFLRRTHPDAEQSYYLYAVDDTNRLEGVVSLRDLVVAGPEHRIAEIMTPEVVSVRTTDDQEEVAREVQRYDFIALPVIDDAGQLVGVVSVDDLMDVAQEEATEDMYRMAGIGVKERAFSPLRESVVRRVPWLTFNMAWAFAGAAMISLFEGTIEQAAAVAIFMPMIAGQAGNAGIQTATITVRSMALGEVELSDMRALLAKEFAMGAIKGCLFGAILGAIAWLWQGNPTLGFVAGVALFLNMLIASTAGVVLPMTMRRFGLDPATIAGVFDTMLTDLMGFLIYLGLATILISRID